MQKSLINPETEPFIAHLANIVRYSDDAIVSKDLNGIITSWNTGAEVLFGYLAEEVLGKPITLLFPEEYLAEEGRFLDTIKKGERVDHYETVRLRKDGKKIHVSLTLSPIRDRQGQIVGVSKIARDVSTRKAAELEILKQKELLSAFVETAAIGLHWVGMDGTITWANAAEMEMLGYSRDEYIGHNIAEFHADADVIADILQRLERGEKLRDYGAKLRCKNGAIKTVLIDSCVLQENGLFVHTQCFTRDVTAQSCMEESLRRTEAELRNYTDLLEKTVQARTAELRETVAALEAFSFSISHDLRAPLRAMKGFSEMVLEDHGGELSPEGRALVQRIHLAADKMARLIEEVLSYNRLMSGFLASGPVDLDQVVREILESYPHLQKPHACIRIANTLPVVSGNGAALKQCMLNLLGNAVKFVPPGRLPEIVVGSETKADFARVWVQDNGIGISAEDLDRIFQMHQRLSGNYEGHGIGLALVRRAVEKMGGRVGVQSDCAKGSLFWMDLLKFKARPEET